MTKDIKFSWVEEGHDGEVSEQLHHDQQKMHLELGKYLQIQKSSQ